jgi:hypothetical protein
MFRVATPEFSDVDIRTATGAAIASMVDQGVMMPRSAAEFGSNTPTSKGEFAVAAQRLFNLPTPIHGNAAPDIPLGTPTYSAVQALAPYFNPHLLCPGCVLGQNFAPNNDVSRGQVIVTLVSILLAQNKLQLLSSVDADAALSRVADKGELSPMARVYFATAITNNVLELSPGNRIDLALPVTRADLAVSLDRLQTKFGIPRSQKAQ